MKVIDLLNMISKGEEVPKIILFNSYKYKFDKTNNEYQRLNYNGTLGTTLGTINALDLYLNEELEIIEEEKKIEQLEQYYDKDLEEYVVETYINGINYKEIYKSKYDEMIIKKISELINEINKMKEGK